MSLLDYILQPEVAIPGFLGGLLTAEEYSRLSDVGEEALVGTTVRGREVPGALDIAQMGLDQTQFRPFTVTTATGGQFGTQIDPTTGQFTTTLGVSPEEQAMQQQLFGGAQQFFEQAQAPTVGREQELFERIRAVQTPEEQRQRRALEERLAAQGRLGIRTAQFGGTPEQLALAKAQEEAQNTAAVQAMQQAQAEQMQQAQLGQQMLGASYMPQAQLLAATQPSQQLASQQAALQQYGAGLFGETAMSGLEARLLQERARANLLGQVGGRMLDKAFTVPEGGGSGGNIIDDIIGGISNIPGLFGFGDD
jgi:hypothetical protein